MKNINIEIPDSLKKEVDIVSKESGMYLKKIVELALIAYIKKHKK